MSEQKQTVAEEKTDDQAKLDTEVKNGAQDDGDELESLLSQFDDEDEGDKSSGKPPKAKATPVEKSSPEPKQEKTGDLYGLVQNLIDRDNEREQSRIRERFDADMKETVKSVRGDVSPKLASDRFVRAWIDSLAEENPKLAKAWVKRNEEPKAFARVVAGLAKEFAKEFVNRPDPKLSEDKDLVAAAVRGASTKAPEGEAPKYSSMSDTEFASSVEKKHGFRPKV